MDAYDFSKPLREVSDISFGMSNERAAEILRELAARIENQQVILQVCRVTTIARIDDFPMTTLRLVMHEKNSNNPSIQKFIRIQEVVESLKDSDLGSNIPVAAKKVKK